MEDTGAEFYTAVDRDGEQRQCWGTVLTRPCPGKEIILRKYLADQWDSAQEGAGFGFVSQALGHLQQEYGEPGAGAGLGGGWPGDTGPGYGGPAYDEVSSGQCVTVATSA